MDRATTKMHGHAMSLSAQSSNAHVLSEKLSFVDVGNGEIAYTSIGSGPPLVLLHGWPLHGHTLRKLLPALSAHFTCHVIDLPGAGASRWSDRTAFSLGGQAESVKVFAARLGLTSYSILSHDTGGTIARQLAIIDAALSPIRRACGAFSEDRGPCHARVSETAPGL